MKELRSIHEHYGGESGKKIVLRFLSNAASWRGENAKRLKAELKELTTADP